MNEIIKLHKTQEGIQNGVDAKDLWLFLGISTRLDIWLKRRIEEYEFTEGIDFCSKLSKSTGGRPKTEYFLTLTMAKELAMIESNVYY